MAKRTGETRLTPLQQEIASELKKVTRRIRSLEKRGYTFDTSPLPRPRKSRKYLAELKELTPKELYSRSEYYDPILGKQVSGTEEQRLTRSRASKKSRQRKEPDIYFNPPREEDIVLNNIYREIANWDPSRFKRPSTARRKEQDKNSLKLMIDIAAQTLGRKQVAINVQARGDDAMDYAMRILYSYLENIAPDRIALREILYGRAMTVEEAKEEQGRFESEYGDGVELDLDEEY